jgi:steroid delta-isomerase-like uncharacterized protein
MRIVREALGGCSMDSIDYISTVKLVQEEVWNKGRVELIDQFYSSDCTVHGTGDDIKGVSAVKETVCTIRRSFPDWYEALEDIFCFGAKVCFRHTSTGTHTGEPFFNVPASGKKVRVPEIGIVKFENGLITEHWAQFDLFSWLTQLGVKVG